MNVKQFFHSAVNMPIQVDCGNLLLTLTLTASPFKGDHPIFTYQVYCLKKNRSMYLCDYCVNENYFDFCNAKFQNYIVQDIDFLQMIEAQKIIQSTYKKYYEQKNNTNKKG